MEWFYRLFNITPPITANSNTATRLKNVIIIYIIYNIFCNFSSVAKYSIFSLPPNKNPN